MSSRPVFIAGIRSLLTYVIVSLYVIVAASVGMLLALVFGWVDILYIFGHIGVRLACALAGIHVRMVGHPPIDRAAVYCSNHQSNVDPPVLFDVLHPRVRIFYKREIDAIPLLARSFRMGGFISVDRRNRESAMQSVDAGAESIRAGHSFLIFPEGTRSKTDELLPFKKGGFIMAIKAQAPIIPVAVQGGRESMRRGSWLIRPVTLSIRVGEAIETAGYTIDDRAQLIARVRDQIVALLAQGPVGT